MHKRLYLAALILVLSAPGICAKTPPRIHISAWYWLNAAPRTDWPRDVQKMAELGFTHVLFGWGLDSSAIAFRTEDTRYVLDLCRKSGLGAYFIIWHPAANTLERRPDLLQWDVLGRMRFTFDTFNPEWRATAWKEYLRSVVAACSPHPALAGYAIDDAFYVGPETKVDGPDGRTEDRRICYNDRARKRFGRALPKGPTDPDWPAWTEARAQWWEEWARDTMRFLREADQDPRHEIYLEDSDEVLKPWMREIAGVDFGRAVRHFDAVGAYTTGGWDGTPEGDRKAVERTIEVLKKTRAAVGPGKKVIYTFWVANPAELGKPGPAAYPTVEQIRQICEAALSQGIRHLDMYGYRIGDPTVTAENWAEKRPPRVGPYQVTLPYLRKHLWDRPEIHAKLGQYLRSLNE